MQIIQIAGLALTATALAVMLRKYSPELALIVSITASIIIFAFVSVNIQEVFSSFDQIIVKSGINSNHLRLIIKITGITYIGQFSSALCKDAGESAIATNIEFCTKIIIMLMTIPIITALFSILANIAM